MILVAAALADDPEAWGALHDARLVEAADGTPEIAVRFYEELLGDLGPTDPLRGSVAYALGRARLSAGNVDGAVAALRVAVADPKVKPEAGVLLALIEQDRRQVGSLPMTWSFEQDAGPLVRGWQGRDEGELDIVRVEGNPAVVWPGSVRGGDTDELAIGLRPGLQPTSVSVRVRATAFPVQLRLACTDGAGARYVGPMVLVPTDHWVELSGSFASFRLVQEPTGNGPERIRSVVLEDLTGVLTESRGDSAVWIDDLVLR